MLPQKYNETKDKLLRLARDIEMKKRPAYTQGNEDVLHNFKSNAEKQGTTARLVLMTYAGKHLDSWQSWAKHPGMPQPEPMSERFADIINYAILANAMDVEETEAAAKAALKSGGFAVGPCPHTVRHGRNFETPENMTHELKIWPTHLQAVADGRKTFEIRIDDRGYRVGDRLHLRGWDPLLLRHTGQESFADVTHIAKDVPGLNLHYVIMSIRLVANWDECSMGCRISLPKPADPWRPKDGPSEGICQ